MPYAVQGAVLVPDTTGITSSGHFRRLVVALVAVALAITLIAVATPTATLGAGNGANSGGHAARIVKIAKTHLGKRFRMGAEGPRVFDCSGLVFRVYQQAGLVGKIGGGRKLAAQYYRWFKQRGLVSRSNPKAGDLIWWTKRGRITHTGLYIGNGRALSALINPHGVRTHGVRSIGVKFLAFGHVRL